ncbi:hypothetical protein ACP26L_36550 (plasmid) [Paenibacillus sp. S-38]|uniref:hypothetical protein n=1 Tax=Paenibacillus sp. S-38 TaxID=3416710 RepID=UPI003CE8482A
MLLVETLLPSHDNASRQENLGAEESRAAEESPDYTAMTRTEGALDDHPVHDGLVYGVRAYEGVATPLKAAAAIVRAMVGMDKVHTGSAVVVAKAAVANTAGATEDQKP